MALLMRNIVLMNQCKAKETGKQTGIERWHYTGQHANQNSISAARFHEELKEIGMLRMEVLALLDHLTLKAFPLKDEQIEHGPKAALWGRIKALRGREDEAQIGVGDQTPRGEPSIVGHGGVKLSLEDGLQPV